MGKNYFVAWFAIGLWGVSAIALVGGLSISSFLESQPVLENEEVASSSPVVPSTEDSDIADPQPEPTNDSAQPPVSDAAVVVSPPEGEEIVPSVSDEVGQNELKPTQTVQVTSARGSTGPIGPVGPAGTDGLPGPLGPAGPQGEQGVQGAAGDTGATGGTGSVGAQGPAGPQGSPGSLGPIGPMGPTGPQGLQGLAGAAGIVTAQSPLVYDPVSQSISLDRSALEYLTNLGYLDFRSGDGSTQIGRLFWNGVDGTLNLNLGGGKVILQLGQEQLQLVRNNTTQTLLNGRAVRATGADEGRVTAEYADSAIPQRSTAILGLLTQDILPGEIGFVTVGGMIRNINTTFGLEGAAVYLGSNGLLVTTRPLVGSIISLGYIIESDAVGGDIFVDTSYTSVPGSGLPCIAGPTNAAGIYKWELAGPGDYYLSCDTTP